MGLPTKLLLGVGAGMAALSLVGLGAAGSRPAGGGASTPHGDRLEPHQPVVVTPGPGAPVAVRRPVARRAPEGGR